MPPQPVRWLLPAALLAIAPKCALCAAAYAGLGASLAVRGSELCGAPDASPDWPGWLAAAGLAGLLVRHVLNRVARA